MKLITLDRFSFPLWFLLAILLTISISIYTRAQDLGYSNFQGDETQTVDFKYTLQGNNVIGYLLEQQRGPTQYAINLINYYIFGYTDEFHIRLPYLIFGILAIFSFYLVTKRLFGINAAVLSSLHVAVNGLFIAFSRITQYQALMYCLIPFAIVVFIKAIDKLSTKHFVYSGLLFAVALVTHYDTLSVLPFLITAFVVKYLRDKNYTKAELWRYLKSMAVFFAFFVLPTLLFYIPFLSHQSFDSQTSGYLGDRLFGGGLMPRTWQALTLISMYEPIWLIVALYFLSMLAALFYTKVVTEIHFLRLNKYLLQFLYAGLIVFNMVWTVLSITYFKPRASTVFVVLSSIAIVGILYLAKRVPYYFVALIAWFLGAYSFYFYLMKDARTHVYVVFIPAFILSGYALYKLYSLIKNRYVRYVFLSYLVAFMVYMIGFNWSIFVNKSPEYPWFNDRYYMGYPIYEIQPYRWKKIEGVFGFNNYRGWEQIKDQFDRGCLQGSFNSNEKNPITYFYIRQNQLRGDRGAFLPDGINPYEYPDNYIVVEGPHSWEYIDQRFIKFTGYDLVDIVYSRGIPVTYIYSKKYSSECYTKESVLN